MFHISAMITVMLFDLGMPFYLYMNRDWKERLIDGGEIISSRIWNAGLVLTLHGLYVIQIQKSQGRIQGQGCASRPGQGHLADPIHGDTHRCQLYEPVTEGG